MPKEPTFEQKVDKIAKGIKHKLDPYVISHNIAHNPADFSHERIMALFIKYGEQQVNASR